MAYADTKCPCGGKKERDTMLCPECEKEFAAHPSMKVFKDHTDSWGSRRHAAIVLLTLARKRKSKNQFTIPLQYRL